MGVVDRSFQVFAKPAGARCNLACAYCYYLDKTNLALTGPAARMSAEVLDAYIRRHIEASSDETIVFSWHGGEQTVLGLEYFRAVVARQRRWCPPGRCIANGLQTNGTLLDEGWASFLARERFAVGISLDGPAALHDRYRLARGGRPTHALALLVTPLPNAVGEATPDSVPAEAWGDFLCAIFSGQRRAHAAGRPAEQPGAARLRTGQARPAARSVPRL